MDVVAPPVMIPPDGFRSLQRRSVSDSTRAKNDPLFTLGMTERTLLERQSLTLSQRELAYSLLLDKGLFRIGQAIPANAEFELLRVEDPYGYASAQELSLYRRPLPSQSKISKPCNVGWARDLELKHFK